MKHITIFSALICSVVISTALAEKPAYTTRDTSLYAEPFKDSEILTDLPARTNLQIVKRKGGWYQVTSPSNAGWVRLITVRLGKNTPSGSTSSADDAVDLLGSLATGREKSSEVTSASAVKGLGEEDLRDATPDSDAVDSLDQFAADDQAGIDAAERAGLTPADINLPIPANNATPAPESTQDNGEEE